MSVDYKQTLNLPDTAFPMKADLARRELERVARWLSEDIYMELRRRAARPSEVRARGWPALCEWRDPHRSRREQGAEGHHRQVAHARRLRLALRAGLGLPRAADRAAGREEIRRASARSSTPTRSAQACREYAASQVEIQRTDFQRLGVMGDWNDPYLTMASRYEAEQLRAFAAIIRRGHLVRGFKPVHWCLDCRSSLAEAEVEYEDRDSPAVDVRFEIADAHDAARRASGSRPKTLRPPRSRSGRRHPGRCPRTRRSACTRSTITCSPSSRARTGRSASSSPRPWSSLCQAHRRELAPRARQGHEGQALEGLRLEHPFYEREVPVILGDHVTLDAGTGAVHTAPGHGADDYEMGRRYGLPIDNPVGNDGRFCRGHAALRGTLGVRCEPEDRRDACASAGGSSISRRITTATRIAGGTSRR